MLDFTMDSLILKGAPSRIPIIDKGVGEYFLEQAETYGDNIFQIDGKTGKTETYRDVKQRSTRVAIYLQKLGVKSKDIIMICCQNNTDNIIPVLAAFYLGAYVASIDPNQTILDVDHVIKLVEPKLIFVENNVLPLIEKLLESLNLKIVCIGNSDKYVNMYDMQIANKEEQTFKPVKQKGSDIAVITFSSGTTSAPKGIYISNSYILNLFCRLSQHNHCKPDIVLHFSSLYWVSAWFVTGMLISTGAAKVVAPSITGEDFLQFVDKYKITYVLAATTFSYEITNLAQEIIDKYDTSSLHNICFGGSTMNPQQILRLRQLLPHSYVSLGYGSTEGNFISCHDHTNQEWYLEKISSSGTVIPEIELKFVDLETGKLVGTNQEGEIRVKSQYVMSGYHNIDIPDTFDEDGFLKIGDIGYYDENKYIYITDRIGEMFKYRINHVYPSLIEHTLLNHPAVAEAIVFGVPHPVDRNHPGACVVLKKETNPSVSELLNFVNSKVSDSHQIRAGLIIVGSIPKTATGKYQRRTIRDIFIKTIKNR